LCKRCRFGILIWQFTTTISSFLPPFLYQTYFSYVQFYFKFRSSWCFICIKVLYYYVTEEIGKEQKWTLKPNSFHQSVINCTHTHTHTHTRTRTRAHTKKARSQQNSLNLFYKRRDIYLIPLALWLMSYNECVRKGRKQDHIS
jgi:hypothetical protein